MKKLYSIIAVVAMATVANAQNLVQNPSFEAGLSPWKKGWNNNYTEPVLKTDGGQDGNNYVSYENPTKATGFYQDITIKPNTKYTLSFWYKTNSSNVRIWSSFKENESSKTGINLVDDNTQDPLRSNNKYLPAATDWKEHIVEFTSPANVSVFQYHVRAYKGGATSFDNFKLVEGDASNLSVATFAKEKPVFVKNTFVNDNILAFANGGDVKIFNQNGQVVKAAKVETNSTLNISSLPAGVYIVVGVVNGEKVSQKIIKK